MTTVTQSPQSASHNVYAFSPVLVLSACSKSCSLPLYAPSPKRPTRLQGITKSLLTGWQEARSGLARLGSSSHSSPVIDQQSQQEDEEDSVKTSFESDNSAIFEFQSIFASRLEEDHRAQNIQDSTLYTLHNSQFLSLDAAPLSPILRTSNPLPYDRSFKGRYQDVIDDVDQYAKVHKPASHRRYTTSSVN